MKKLALASLLSMGSILAAPATAQQAPPAQPAPTANSVIYLDQAWSQEDREWYYNFSQGSAIISYDIYLNLEVADSQELSSIPYIARVGLIPQAANPSNPDGLPIGISKTKVATPIKGWPAGDYAGLTCAACHTGQLNYKASAFVLREVVSPTVDLQGLIRSLDEALQATLTDAANLTVWRRG